MTTPVSQTTFADNTENTKNTEDNRKVVGVDYEEDDNTKSTKNTKDNRMIIAASYSEYYTLPDNLDLENNTIVKRYFVNWQTLKIEYTTEEYYKLYSGSNEPSKDNKHIQEIGSHDDLRLDCTVPDNYELVSAKSRWVEYSDYEEDEDETEGLFLDENSYNYPPYCDQYPETDGEEEKENEELKKE